MTNRSALRGGLVAALMIAALPAWAVKPFSATYDASVRGVQAPAQMTLTSAGGDRWTYELVIDSPVASVRQSTTFSENGGNWRPLSGVDTTQVLIKRSQKSATYDWGKREARWSGDVKADRMGPVKLQDGDVDGMLINLAIVRDVAAGKPLSYRLVENGVVRQHVYQVQGKENITVAGQSRSATKLGRNADGKEVQVWVVEGLPVPARIVQREGGRTMLELNLRAVR